MNTNPRVSRLPHHLLTHLKFLGMVQTTSPVNGNITDLKDKYPIHSHLPAYPQSWELKVRVRVKVLSPRTHTKGEGEAGLWSPCCSAGLLLAEMHLCNGSRIQRARETLGCREEEQIGALLLLPGLPTPLLPSRPLQSPFFNNPLSLSYTPKLTANLFNKYFGPNHVPNSVRGTDGK